MWVGVGGFSKVVATFNHVGGPFVNIYITATNATKLKLPHFLLWDVGYPPEKETQQDIVGTLRNKTIITKSITNKTSIIILVRRCWLKF